MAWKKDHSAEFLQVVQAVSHLYKFSEADLSAWGVQRRECYSSKTEGAHSNISGLEQVNRNKGEIAPGDMLALKIL